MNRPGMAMKHQATRELFDYWNSLRGSRPAPERAEIDLAAIRGLIADMFMLDIDAAHVFPFVLSGTRVNALACAEQNGRSFLDLWSPEEARNIAAMLLTVMDASCPLVATAVATPEGFPDHKIEILFLPLGRRGQDRARILGLIAPTTSPSWLGLLPVKNLTLRSLRAMDDAPAPLNVDLRCLVATAPLSPQAWPVGKQTRNIRHLRIFDGGRQISSGKARF